MKSAHLILLSVLLTGCLSVSQSVITPSKCKDGESCSKTFTEIEHGYSLSIPAELPRWTTFSYGLDSPSYPSFTTPIDNIGENRLTIFYAEKPCSAALMGTSKTTSLQESNGQAEWGKMDFYKDRGMEGWEPSSDESLLICHGGGTPPPESVYSFCSEKNGKTVVICINQMTDNPQLAEDIFKTFRWTK